MRPCLLLLSALLAVLPAAAQKAPDTRRSGYEDMRPSTQAMQRDDAQNPAMLWVADGEALFRQPPLPQSKACIACHSVTSLRGVAARYPAFDPPLARPVSLSHRINLCRQRHQAMAPWDTESQPLLALETYVANQSRGEPISPPDDPRLEPFRQRGQQLFMQRIGQLGLSCAQCHDQSAGLRLGGSTRQHRIARLRHFGQAQDQRLNLQPGEHLRRQGGVLGQRIARPGLAVDQRATRAQGLDVAVERAFGHAHLLGKSCRRDRLGQHPKSRKQAEQAVGLGHVILTGSGRSRSLG